ncbi:polysaccharide biosynthesis C-terminal domain-containing protein [Tessaracoccus sp. Y1736]
MTGAGGFLGWHTRAALLETGTKVAPVRVGDGFDLAKATKAIDGAPRLIHIAGVNRASEDEILAGNVSFAEQMAAALRRTEAPPPVIVFANSTQADNGSAYGEGKARAAGVLAAAALEAGSEFVDLKLPNLFGEHGRPFYNAVTATFCHLISQGNEPTVEQDRELTLLHVQNAADLLTGTTDAARQDSLQRFETVAGLLGRLLSYESVYKRGEIPDISDPFDRDLFNTYRSYAIDPHAPIHLSRHADQRGSFFEVIRSHGGPGQSSFSTTAPGIVRGDHYHRRKVERFTVLAGQARISLRRVFTSEVFDLDVDGDHPVAVDMPTMWTHMITNTGVEPLYTAFWTNDLFNPNAPDTIQEPVSILEI